MKTNVREAYKEIRGLYLGALSRPNKRRYLSKKGWLAEDVFADLKKARIWLEKTLEMYECLKAKGLPVRRVCQGFEGYTPSGNAGCFANATERECFERKNPNSVIEIDKEQLEDTIPYLETILPESGELAGEFRKRWEIESIYDRRLANSGNEPYRDALIYLEGPQFILFPEMNESRLGRLIVTSFDEALPDDFKREIVILHQE